MEAYTSFAEVYDQFMDNVPYREWADFLQEILQKEGINDGLVLDLGCGTGSMTEELAGRGYDIIGVDNSEDMLEIAMEKRQESGHDILYLLQDMQEFELYGTVRAVVSVCDSVNYVTEKKSWSRYSGWSIITWIPAGFSSLILIRNINTGRFWETGRLRKTGKIPALSGITIIMKKNT